jgi:hypothetical protein
MVGMLIDEKEREYTAEESREAEQRLQEARDAEEEMPAQGAPEDISRYLAQWADVAPSTWGTPESQLPSPVDRNNDRWGCSEEEAEAWDRYQGYMEDGVFRFDDVER